MFLLPNNGKFFHIVRNPTHLRVDTCRCRCILSVTILGGSRTFEVFSFWFLVFHSCYQRREKSLSLPWSFIIIIYKVPLCVERSRAMKKANGQNRSANGFSKANRWQFSTIFSQSNYKFHFILLSLESGWYHWSQR